MTQLPFYVVGGTESLLPVPVNDIQQAFVERIQLYFPENPVIWVPVEDIRNGLNTQLGYVRKVFGNPFLVTLSQLYFPNQWEISCTRLTNLSFDKLGIVPRPGSLRIEEQVAKVTKAADGNPIVVIDDTLFHGDTLEYLMRNGLKISAAVEYFTSQDAKDKVESWGIQVFMVKSLGDYIDVMPVHDWLPGAPLCGKVINGVDTEYCNGYHAHSFPYVYPFISLTRLKEWSSIPEEYGLDFSAFALTQAVILAERLRSRGIDTFADVANEVLLHHVPVPYLRNIGVHYNQPLHELLQKAIYCAMADN